MLSTAARVEHANKMVLIGVRQTKPLARPTA